MRVEEYATLAMLAFFLIVLPIWGLVEGNWVGALIGPAYVLFFLVVSYLFSGHWLRFFRKNDGE